jgi:mRNA interferase MazF
VIRPGDIRWFRFQAPDKRRPVLVLGRDETQVRGLRWEVALSDADGLPTACVLKAEWIRSVERAYIGPLIASFPSHRWGEVREALLDVLGLSGPRAG